MNSEYAKMQDWDDLRFFLSVARTGTVSAAAVKLGVNQSTVSRRINSFEKEIKVRLFERLSTGYELTPEGEELQHRVLLIEDEVQAIDRHIMGRNIELSGPIRITTSLAMVRYLLMPIFKHFNLLHPDIELHVDMSDNIYNLTQREADIAIRVTRDPIPENLIGRELGLLKFGVYGENKYLESYNSAKGKKPLRWIGEDNNDVRPNWLPENVEPLHLVMRSNQVLATLDAIEEGLGVGRLPCFIGDTGNKLTKLKLNKEVSGVPVWLLTHVDLRRVNRMSVFTSFMVEEMRKQLNYGVNNG